MLSARPPVLIFFFFNDTATTEIYTLSLHDALPISANLAMQGTLAKVGTHNRGVTLIANELLGLCHLRSEEHTSELQSPCNLVCRLLLEKKKLYCSRLPGLYTQSFLTILVSYNRPCV